MALDLKTYLQTVTATQKCDLYALDMKNYERLVARRNPKTIVELRELAAMKLTLRMQRFHDNQLPLLKTLVFHMRRRGDRKQQQQRKRRIDADIGVPLASDGLPARGPIIDQYGPGTVYYRLKMREKAQREHRERLQFRGANTAVHVSSLKVTPGPRPPPVAIQPASEVGSDSDDCYDELLEAESPCPRGQPLASTFKDWDSSDRELTQLEERIRAWHNVDGGGIVGGGGSSRTKLQGPSTVRLRRVTLQKGKPLKPGTKVVLRPKRHRENQFMYESPTSDVDNGHSYVDRGSPLKQNSLPSGFTINEEGGRDGDSRHKTRASSHSVITKPWHSRFVFHLKKTKPRHQYTAAEYQELKKQLLYRQRSMGYIGLA
ncbi:hypothetical protein LSAT2_022920 [Lamellibrachia satsuma]|nr:hypothetical protein LSAT2_022920 [Lamellibrachia satsuma]